MPPTTNARVCVFFPFLFLSSPPPTNAGSGQIDASEFYKLMQDCNGAAELKGSSGCSEADVQSFMNDLDKDGNGLLDLDEFVAFIVDNLSMSPEARRAFKEKSKLHGQLSDMMISMTDKISESLGKAGGSLGKSMYSDLPDKMERRIEFVVERLYKKYDDDDSNSIDANEYFKLMLDVIGTEEGHEDEDDAAFDKLPTKEDALHFIRVIGTTISSSVEDKIELEKDDFLGFTLKVLTSTSKQRISFAARSRTHHKLLGFFLILIADSLDIVESDLDRTQFKMKEKRQFAAELKIQREKDLKQIKQDEASKQNDQLNQRNNEQELINKKKDMINKVLAEATQPPPLPKITPVKIVPKMAQKTEETKSEAVPLPPPSPQQVPLVVPSTLKATEYDNKTPEAQNAYLMSRLDMYTSFVWDKYDLDKDGSLNSSEFETFLKVITQRGDAITSEDCSRFLRQMDRSGDGKLQRDELVSFAGSGFEMGEEEAKEYASRSVMHELLVVFINKIKGSILYDEDFELQVKAAGIVKDIWAKHDTNASGMLEAASIRTLIQEVMDLDGEKHDAPTLEEATRFISFLDIDGDGCIDQSEFLKFICNALSMTVDLRIQFAQRSPMHAKVSGFCCCCCCCCNCVKQYTIFC